jgi:hypothetical protein
MRECEADFSDRGSASMIPMGYAPWLLVLDRPDTRLRPLQHMTNLTPPPDEYSVIVHVACRRNAFAAICKRKILEIVSWPKVHGTQVLCEDPEFDGVYPRYVRERQVP